MNGPEIFAFTLRVVPKVVHELLARAAETSATSTCTYFHQANQYMLEHLRKKLKIPAEKFFVGMRHCGNTVSCTIPIALKQAVNEGRIQPGHLVMLVGFGVGYSWRPRSFGGHSARLPNAPHPPLRSRTWAETNKLTSARPSPPTGSHRWPEPHRLRARVRAPHRPSGRRPLQRHRRHPPRPPPPRRRLRRPGLLPTSPSPPAPTPSATSVPSLSSSIAITTPGNLDPELLRHALQRRAAIGRLPKAVVVVDLFGSVPTWTPFSKPAPSTPSPSSMTPPKPRSNLQGRARRHARPGLSLLLQRKTRSSPLPAAACWPRPTRTGSRKARLLSSKRAIPGSTTSTPKSGTTTA